MSSQTSNITEIKVKYSDIITNQATLNIGTIGHVSHGKTTTVSQLTGERTQKHAAEIKSNKTIHIGYANSKIWRSDTGKILCTPSKFTHMIYPEDGKPMTLISHISFVDCPGHADFMCTMIGGTSAMNAVFLLIAVNDPIFPQSQTYEHLLAMATTKVDNYLILQNKVDLVQRQQCIDNKQDILNFINGSPANGAPIIPISAQLGQNMNVIGEYIANGIPQAKLDPNTNFRMFIVRSFDNNRPNTPYKKLIGGSVGGSIIKGCVMKGDILEIRPGYIYRNEDKFICQPIISQVNSLYCGKESLNIAFPGGLKAIGMNFDPALSKLNGLAGQIIGTPGTLPDIYHSITFVYKKLNKRDKKLNKMRKGDEIVICVNAKTIPCTIINIATGKMVTVTMAYPVCIDTDLKITILRKTAKQLAIYASANFVTGVVVETINYPSQYQNILENLPQRHIDIEYDVNYPKQSIEEYIDYNKDIDKITFQTEDNMESDMIQIIDPEVVNKNRDSILINYKLIRNSFNKTSSSVSANVRIQKMIETLETMECEMVNISEFLTTFIKDELKTTASVNDREQLILRGSYRNIQLRGVMTKFVQKYSLCTNCNSYNTLVSKQRNNRTKILSITCLKCSATSSIN
jgi:translation initiation factor 2 subunit 3